MASGRDFVVLKWCGESGEKTGKGFSSGGLDGDKVRQYWSRKL